jgi:hypothetical protein
MTRIFRSIDHTQAAETHVRRIVVIGEAEGVMAIQPTVIGVTAFGGSADGESVAACFHKESGISGVTSHPTPCLGLP